MSRDLSEPLRSHKDLDKGAAPFYEKAEKFYDGLANQLVNQGHVLDIFASALDQVFVFFFVSLLQVMWKRNFIQLELQVIFFLNVRLVLLR